METVLGMVTLSGHSPVKPSIAPPRMMGVNPDAFQAFQHSQNSPTSLKSSLAT